MRFSLTSLIRLIALGALTSTMAAAGLSRLVPKPSMVLIKAPPRYVCVNGMSLAPVASGSFLLDTEAGVLTPLSPVNGVAIEYATCSPWSDGRNPLEVVGRSTLRHGLDTRSLCQGLGLGRASVPLSTVHEHLPMSPVITGRPCWLQGKPSRIVFPAGDGQLYVEDLDEAEKATEEASPRPIVWACSRVGDPGGVFALSDPVSPIIPSLGGRLFVTMSSSEKTLFSVLGPSEIWWLKLDAEGRSIVAAGRVSARADHQEARRMPNVCVAADGRLVLAYLARSPSDPEWHLKLTTLAIDPASSAPTADTEAACDLGRGFSTTPPAFSPDGRWVFGIPRCQPTPRIVQRFSVLDALRRTSEGVGD